MTERTRTTGSFKRVARWTGLVTGAIAIAGTLSGGVVYLGDSRWAQAKDVAAHVTRAELPKLIRDEMEVALRPIQEEQSAARQALQEVRCILLKGAWVIGACEFPPGRTP